MLSNSANCARFHGLICIIHAASDRLPSPIFLGFPCGSAGKESTCSMGDLGSIPGLGRSPAEGKGYPLQYSGLENSMDYTHGVSKSQTRLRGIHFHFHFFGGLSDSAYVKHYPISKGNLRYVCPSFRNSMPILLGIMLLLSLTLRFP